MSFYEFKEPYYALIKSHTTNEVTTNISVPIYEKNVSKLDGDRDSLKFINAKGKQIWEDEAFFIFSRAEENKSKSYGELKKEFKDVPFDTLLVLDSSLS